MNNQRSFHTSICTELITTAERELAAFVNAVTELYGAEQARLSAEIWLEELQVMEHLPGPARRDWRMVTVAALARLAGQLNATALMATPSSNCSDVYALL